MAVTSKARRFLSQLQLHKQFGKYSVPFSALNDIHVMDTLVRMALRRQDEAAGLRISARVRLIRLGAPD